MNRITTAAILLLVAPAVSQTTPAIFMNGDVSGDKNDYNLSLSGDGRTMVFARSEVDFHHAKIMIASRTSGQNWPTPKPIAFSDDRWRDSDPWLTPDGQTLYFVSDRPTRTRPEKRDLDIWRSARGADGSWGPPEHLGDLVNGAGEELGPELHGGLLYFASAKKSGKGGLDIYVARAKASGFEKPELMPEPINSGASESDFTLSAGGNVALFWREVNGRGLLHISHRANNGGWSPPEALPPTINIGTFNFTPALSPDGTHVTFASTRPREGQAEGLADIYRTRLFGPSSAFE